LLGVCQEASTVKQINVPAGGLRYWPVVVTIRTAGTSAGDYFARGLGLHESALVFAAVLTTLLLVWHERRRTARTSLQPGAGVA
jgi:uncharacterized membrane-anchored protein